MKKIKLFLLAILWMGGIGVKGQDILAKWNFEDQSKRDQITDHLTFLTSPYTVDEGTLSNVNFYSIELYGGSMFYDWVNGSGGSGTFAPNTRSWDHGTMNKFWQISFSSLDYQRLTISSRQQSSSTGPRDFKLQYSLDGLNWTDVPGANILVANNFTSGVLENINLPEECDNQSEVFLRWIMVNEISVAGGTVGSTGTNRIDDIIIWGFKICGSESFANATLTGNYSDGSFFGDDGIIWHYSHSRNEYIYPISGKGLMLRDASVSRLESGTISGGISSFSLLMRKAYSNNNPRQLGLYINNQLVGISEVFGIDEPDETIYTFEVTDINIPGDFFVTIKNVGSTSMERQTVIDNISWTCYELPECITTNHFFRSAQSGTWENNETWEVSLDGINDWSLGLCPPDYRAAGINVRNEHQVNINQDLYINKTIVEPGALLRYGGGKLHIMNHVGPGLIVYGMFEHDFNILPRIFGQVEIRTGGVLSVSRAISGIAEFYVGNESTGKIRYHDRSVFEWNNATLFSTSGQTFFPDVALEDIPIFRIKTAPTQSIGGAGQTMINGLLEANANLEWRGSGPKTFRNGITGTGNITQATTSGPFVITGMNAQLTGPGILQLNANGLQINGNVSMGSNKTIAGGPVTINGSLHAGTFALTLGGSLSVGASGSLSMADATLILNGDATQSLLLTQPLTLNGLTVFNPAGVNANQNITIRNNLVMNGGSVEVGENILTLGISGVQTGSLTRTSGAVNGKFQRWIPSVVSADDVLFPVGKGTRYVPVRLRFLIAPAAGTLTGEFISIIGDNTQYYGNLPIQDGDLTIDNLSSAGYWIIDAGDGFGPAPYEIAVFPDDVMQFGLNSPERARIVKRVGEFEPWEIAGSFQTGEVTQIRHTNVNSGFSQFALGGNMSDNPLPVELLRFEARNLSDKVLLEWSTATETNNDHFIVERSTDMHEIVPLGKVAGAGNSNNILHYLFTDQDPLAGINYYRLKQTDFDGTFEYSDWIAVHLQEEPSDFFRILHVVQKNDKVKLAVKTRDGARINISVSDIHGRVMCRSEFTAISDVVRYEFDPVASGVLIVTVADGYSRMTEKLLIVPR
jgi:hypothetical protein